jgi:signal transduction histidine kinase
VELRVAVQSAPLNVALLVDGPEEKFVNRAGFKNGSPLFVLTVADTGSGIAPENMRKIFEETFTTQVEGQGTGLGLSIVQRLVERSGGGIHVRTKVGQGTQFLVYLPMQVASGAE